MNPQIIKSYAANIHDETMGLVYRGTRFSYYLLLLLTLPLFFEMDFVLNLWLTDVPELTVEFCQVLLVTSLLQCLSNLFATVAKAYGKIRNYQIMISITLFLNFPMSLLFLYLGFGALATAFIALFVQLIALFLRMILIKSMIRYSILDYTYKVLLPLFTITVASCIIPYFVVICYQESMQRFILNVISTFLTTFALIYFMGLSPSEKSLIVSTIRNRFFAHK
jgi:Na+-driven multidrug efflux pump